MHPTSGESDQLFDISPKFISEAGNIITGSEDETYDPETDRRVLFGSDYKTIYGYTGDWIDDAIDNLLFSGKREAIEAIKKARSLFKKREELFAINPIKKGGLKIDDKA